MKACSKASQCWSCARATCSPTFMCVFHLIPENHRLVSFYQCSSVHITLRVQVEQHSNHNKKSCSNYKTERWKLLYVPAHPLILNCWLGVYFSFFPPSLSHRVWGWGPNLLLILLPGYVAPFDVPVTEIVAEIAEDGQDAIAHVCEHSHQHGRLFERLDEGSAVQAVVMWCSMTLEYLTTIYLENITLAEYKSF